MKIVSFNLRYDNAGDGNLSFKYRRDHIASYLLELKPDLVAFQEALPEMVDWLREHMTGYYLLGHGRNPDYSGESMILAYRIDTMVLHSTRTFWLSETPDVPGSRYKHQSICPRTCMASVLYSRESKKLIRVLNTHLDHEGAPARISGLEQILSFFEAENSIASYPTVIMGDFNAMPGDRELKCIDSHPAFCELSKEIGGTFHDFGELKQPIKIDYIYGTHEFKLLGSGTLTDDKGYLSDHYPIYVDVEC